MMNEKRKARMPRTRRKVDCEVGMVHQSEWPLKEKRVIKYVENHDEECGTASQAVQHFEVLFSATGAVENCGYIHQSVAPRRTVCTAFSRVCNAKFRLSVLDIEKLAQVSETSANQKAPQ
jgi:hypothetical protein